MKKFYTQLIGIAAVSFALNALWEYIQLPLYTGYEHLGSGTGLIFWATAGDVMYTLIACLLVCFEKGGFRWITKPIWRDYTSLGFIGLMLALFVEYKAMALHRWAYTTAMPTVFHVGLTPLLQLTVLVPFSVFIASRLAKFRR